MVDDTDGNWWILYHAYEKGYMNQGRKVLLEPVVFTEDGWPVIEGSCGADLPRRKPAGWILEGKDSLSDSFEGPLNPLWQMYGSVDYERAQAKNGILRLKAVRAESPGESHPLIMIPGDHSYCMETTLCKPDIGCEAGMILLYDPKHFGALSWKGDQVLLYRLGKILMKWDTRAEKLHIRMRNDRNYLAFYIGEDDRPMHKLNYVQNVEPMCAAAYGGFGSLRGGLFASGEGEAKFGPLVYTAAKE